MINSVNKLKSNKDKYNIMKALAKELIELNYTYRDTEKIIQEYCRYFDTPLLIADSNIQGLEKMLYTVLKNDEAEKLLNEFLKEDVRLLF